MSSLLVIGYYAFVCSYRMFRMMSVLAQLKRINLTLFVCYSNDLEQVYNLEL